jgi:hypothetical protein
LRKNVFFQMPIDRTGARTTLDKTFWFVNGVTMVHILDDLSILECLFNNVYPLSGYFHHPQNIQAAQTRHSQSAQPSQPVAPSYPSYSNHQQPQSDDLPSYRTKPKAKKSTEAEYDAFVDMNGLANDLPSYSQSSNPAPQHSVTQAAQKPKNKTPKTATPQYPKSNNSKGSNVKASGNYCMPDFLSSAPAPESLPMPSFAPTSTPTQVKSPPFAPTPKQLHFVSPPQTASPTAVNAFLSTLPISVTKPQPPPQSPPQYKPAAPSQSNVRPMQQMPVVPQVVRPPVVTSAPQAVAVAPVAAPATASAAPQLILRKQGRVEVVALK